MGFKGWWSELLTGHLGTTKPSLESLSGRGESVLKCICVLTSCD